VSVSDFYKVYGYACIYITLNEIAITDLTITFVESRYPRELIKHLENVRGYTVAKTSAGVYTVKGDILPIQIIDSRKLSAEENVWLKNLRKNLNRSDIEKSGLGAKYEEREREKWTSVLADKDAEIARLRAQLENKQ